MENASNMVGYLDFINRSEYKRLKTLRVQHKRPHRKGGLEAYYDDYLRGLMGENSLRWTSRGREVGTLGFQEPVREGFNLSVDIELQKYCDELMAGKRRHHRNGSRYGGHTGHLQRAVYIPRCS